MDIYDEIINAIRDYLHEDDYKTLFLHGGCYWFAATVASWVPNAYLMINHTREHCAVMVDQKLCDITGKISKDGYAYADERAIRYMKKYYIPEKNLKALDQYIRNRMQEYSKWKRLHLREELNCNN